MRAASVYGQTFWKGGVKALLGGAISDERLDQWLEDLVDREVITRHVQSRFPAEPELAFRNGLVREAAHAMLTENDRILGHRLAAGWMENVGERDPLVLAEHLDLGKQPEKAIAWYLEAARQATEGNDMGGALARAERGVACGAQGQELAHLRLLQAEAHGWRGENADAERRGQEALDLLPPGGNLWLRAAQAMAAASAKLARPERVVAAAQMVRDSPGADAPSAERLLCLAEMVIHVIQSGNAELIGPLLGQIDAAPQAVAAEPEVKAQLLRMRELLALFDGDIGLALRLSEESASSFASAGDTRNALMRLFTGGATYLVAGGFEQAETTLRECLRQTEPLDLHFVSAMAKENLGMALAYMGRFDEARAIEKEAVADFIAQNHRRMEGGARVYLATIEWLAGKLDDALPEADQAMELLGDLPSMAAQAAATRAAILLALRRRAEALAAARDAMGYLEAMHGKLEEGESLVRLVLAEALFANGLRDQARDAIRSARVQLMERAQVINDLSWREAFLGRVPENLRTLELSRQWLGE